MIQSALRVVVEFGAAAPGPVKATMAAFALAIFAMTTIGVGQNKFKW